MKQLPTTTHLVAMACSSSGSVSSPAPSASPEGPSSSSCRRDSGSSPANASKLIIEVDSDPSTSSVLSALVWEGGEVLGKALKAESHRASLTPSPPPQTRRQGVRPLRALLPFLPPHLVEQQWNPALHAPLHGGLQQGGRMLQLAGERVEHQRPLTEPGRHLLRGGVLRHSPRRGEDHGVGGGHEGDVPVLVQLYRRVVRLDPVSGAQGFGDSRGGGGAIRLE